MKVIVQYIWNIKLTYGSHTLYEKAWQVLPISAVVAPTIFKHFLTWLATPLVTSAAVGQEGVTSLPMILHLPMRPVVCPCRRSLHHCDQLLWLEIHLHSSITQSDNFVHQRSEWWHLLEQGILSWEEGKTLSFWNGLGVDLALLSVGCELMMWAED